MRIPLTASLIILLLITTFPFSQGPSNDTINTLDEVFEEISRRVPGFAGFHYRNETLVISLARPEPAAYAEATQMAAVAAVAHMAAVAEQIREGRFTFQTVQYSFGQLAQWRQAILSNQQLRNVMTALDVDEANNRLFLGVSSPEHVETAKNILNGLGLPQNSYHVEHLVIEPMVGLRDRVRPVVGGLQIGFSVYLCTLGFTAIRNGVPGYVTNDHCTDNEGQVDGTNHYQPSVATNNLIGQETVDPPFFTGSPCPSGRRCRYSDAAFGAYGSGVSFSLGKIARTASLVSLEIVGEWTIVEEASNQISGQVLNKVGRTTGWTQGSVIGTCVTTNVSGTNMVRLCQTFVQAGVGPGDSGSPVFKILDSSAGTVELHGILWGGNSDGTVFVFSPIANVEYELGSLETTAQTSSITVLSPNGGETLMIGESVQIQWSSQNIAGNVDILLSRNGGTSWSVLLSNVANDGSESWTVTGPPTSSAKIRIRSTANPSVFDDSNDVFTIGFSITVLSPDGGETWSVGTIQTITWSSQSYGTVKIEISRNGGTSWTTIVSSITNDGSHEWTVTGPTTSNALIRITSNEVPLTVDTSDNVFSIVDTSPPAVRVIRPNGGENLRWGSTYTIRWTASDPGGIQRVVIEYSVDGGNNWQLVAGLDGNPGFYRWRVPRVPTQTAVIRITAYDFAGNSGSDVSDAFFRIRR